MARWVKQEEEAPARKADHWCAVAGCGKPGSMSHGLLGFGPWYCAKHFWGGGAPAQKPAVTLADRVARERQRLEDDDGWETL